ncbi:putative UbiE/COQ5 family methyltransferase [Rhodotorula toruloides]|uniref:Putative UbiE/COQ5 family methyltransferase n=2 Tax=Rhodotorula toruloides TaxID=5286 RepID=A0A2T0AIF7_RHOTO|nr:putative UbiE/COQ5 family methyltransferase [Rhodotorula toruloides]PRQ77805.1 putative UbiE/COQ5 family methyltransferase [Rhodotorula toruloides]
MPSRLARLPLSFSRYTASARTARPAMTDSDFRPSFSHFGGPEIAMMERFTGGQAAKSLLELSGIYEAIERADKPVEVVENAAGAGVLTHALKEKVKDEGKVRIVMGDVEEKMVDLAKQRCELEGWKDVEVKVMDGMNVPLPDNSFDFAFIHFGLQLFPDAAKGISECHRLLRPSGVLGYTIWHSPGFLPLLQRADPSFRMPLTFSNPFTSLPTLSTTLSQHGFHNPRTAPIEVPAHFESTDKFFEMMRLGMRGLFMDEERNERMRKLLVEEHGEGEFTLWWRGASVVATKAE